MAAGSMARLASGFSPPCCSASAVLEISTGSDYTQGGGHPFVRVLVVFTSEAFTTYGVGWPLVQRRHRYLAWPIASRSDFPRPDIGPWERVNTE